MNEAYCTFDIKMAVLISEMFDDYNIWVRRTINKLYMYNYEECMVVETAKEYVRYIQLVIF